jgi:hypothetical protein
MVKIQLFNVQRATGVPRTSFLAICHVPVAEWREMGFLLPIVAHHTASRPSKVMQNDIY